MSPTTILFCPSCHFENHFFIISLLSSKTWLFDVGLLNGVHELFAKRLESFVFTGGANVIMFERFI